jgi:hypothetical protein
MLVYFTILCCLPLIGLLTGVIVLPRATSEPLAYART